MNNVQQPIGPGNGVFTDADLAKLAVEFPGRTIFYGNPEHTIVCIDTWCSYKPQAWTMDVYVPSNVPRTVVTPEPVLTVELAVLIVILLLFVLLRKQR